MRTYVALILDKSGSMASTKKAAISGFNEQVQQLKEDAKNQEIFCSLVTFNGEVFEHLWNVPADQLAEANEADYQPVGSTSMRDAVGYTIQKMLNTTDSNHPDNAYLFFIISDGETNSDRHYSIPALRELTESCQKTNKWTFTYVGCGKEYLEEIARQTATPISNMAAWSNSNSDVASRGFDNIKSRQKKYFAERQLGQTSAQNFSSDTDNVADYCSEALEAAPAPVLKSVSALDVPEILSKTPRYTQQASVKYNGESLFRNSLQVKWDAENAAPENISASGPVPTKTP